MTYKEAREAAIDAFWKKGLISKTRCGEQLDAALSAFSAGGWELVPKVATETISELLASAHAFEDDAGEVYESAIAAALKERT